MSANPYEAAAREKKVTRLVDALDAELRERCTEEILRKHQSNAVGYCNLLHNVLVRARIKSASQITVDALVERIRERDRMHAKVKK